MVQKSGKLTKLRFESFTPLFTRFFLIPGGWGPMEFLGCHPQDSSPAIHNFCHSDLSRKNRGRSFRNGWSQMDIAAAKSGPLSLSAVFWNMRWAALPKTNSSLLATKNPCIWQRLKDMGTCLILFGVAIWKLEDLLRQHPPTVCAAKFGSFFRIFPQKYPPDFQPPSS